MAQTEVNVAEHVRNWGRSASIALFDPACKFFSMPEVEGVIGYRDECQCAVVFGDPVCASENKARLAKAFEEFCEKTHRNIIYLATSPGFAKAVEQSGRSAIIEIGDDLFVDPHFDPKPGVKGHALRGLVNRAKRAGVTIHEYREPNAELEKAIDQVGVEWLKSRKGPQIFITHVDLFAERTGKRWFYAQKEDRLVGVILLSQLESLKGYVLQFLMITPDAPNGTSELLVTGTMELLAKEKCHYMTFGVAQGSALGEVTGLNPFWIWIARAGFKGAKRIFPLDGRRRFWKKFQPQAEPSYLVFVKPRIGFYELRSLMRALNANI